ncbi:MAG: hypothetical protein ACI8O8_001219 [Oleiphilaceae bacterium]|jgi:hypothetical protein
MKLHHITEQLKEFKQKLSRLKGNTLKKPDLHENNEYDHIVVIKKEHSDSEHSHKTARTRLESSLTKPQAKAENIMEEIVYKNNKN